VRGKRIVMAVCLPILAGAMPANAAAVPAGFHQLTMTDLKASIAYPAGWRPVWTKGHEFFYGPRANRFTSNVNIYFVSHPQAASLADFGRMIKSADAKTGARIGHTLQITVGGIPALSIRGRLSQTLQGRVVRDRFTIAAFLVRDQGWQITLSASPGTYWANMKLFRTMLHSFALTS
jgi:hypothetical protein